MRVHLIGVAGTGMGTLAGLLASGGHRVSGSDSRFYPPMGDALVRWGIETHAGYHATNIPDDAELVVIGNACRPDHVEARAAIERGFSYRSMAGALRELVLAERENWVIAGTHGKTTTSTLTAFLMQELGRDPGYFIGGIPRDLRESFAVGSGPFIVEGDEYDSAFFEKTPKFWQYAPRAVILTSIEHDHIDIYPDSDAYRAAFIGLVERLPEDGLLVAFAGDPEVRRVAGAARCRVIWYALAADDTGDISPTWTAAPIASQGGMQPFDMFVGGTSCGPVLSPLSGEHNIRNTLASIALIAEHGFAPVQDMVSILRRFRGARRRQERIADVRRVIVYDDFAHHPTAVRETLRGLRARHPEGRLIAVFEPRSATACRSLHQDAYAESFYEADLVWIAPLGRALESDRLDVAALVAALRERDIDAHTGELDTIVQSVRDYAAAGDTIVLMSNGDLGGLADRLIASLAVR